MSETVSVVFKGAVLPGTSLDEAKAHAALAFKLSPEKCEALFSGRTVVLRKGLPAGELASYLERVERMGMQVEVLPEVAAAAPESVAISAPASAPVVTPAAVPDTPAIDEISCPQCGERQPRRTLCRSCSIDMPRFAAARQQAEDDVRAEARAARADAPRSAAVRAALLEDRVRFFDLSFDQRISRSVYALSSFVGMGAMALLLIIALHYGFNTGTLLLLLVGCIATLIWGVRMTILRLHDLGWSGWWYLLFLLPGIGQIAGFVLWLLLSFKRGVAADNDWGSQAPAASGVSVVAGLLISCVLLGLALQQAVPLLEDPEALMAIADPEAAARASAKADAATDLSSFDAQRNSIVLYSLSNCPQCADKRQLLRGAGLSFTEYLVDQDQARAAELGERLQREGVQSQVALPVIVVNSKLLPGNPSISEIAKYLKR